MSCSVQHGGKIATFLNRNQLHEMKMIEDAWIGDDYSITKPWLRYIYIEYFLGLHRDKDFQIWANSKSIHREEIFKMESIRSLDQKACPDCDCAYLDKKSKIRWAKCKEKRYYLCEYKGKISSFEPHIDSDL